MKTLKFMLAAAAAIGLASATQADQYNTTGFEKLTVGDPVTTGVTDNDSSSYFYYAGANAEDNESVIAAAGDMTGIARPRGAASVDATRNNILQVSTGTDPLLRTYAPLNGSTLNDPSALTADTYVDTLVQFTVTPYTDTVTPNAADKLMIYLKESATTNEFGEVTSTSTNLVVLGRYLDNSGGTMVFSTKEYVAATSVVPGQWYRLTVKLIKTLTAGGSFEVQQYPAFQVFLNGQLCSFDGPCVAAAAPFFIGNYLSDISNSQVVLSLLADGTTPASLQAVGFAGEGKVDDIVFSDLNPFATVFDFTFAFDTSAGVQSVTYTVAGVQYDQAKVFPEVESNAVVTITAIQYASGYVADAITPVGLTASGENTWTVTSAGASLTVTAQEQQQTGWVDDPTIVSNQTAATAYPALAGSALANADAQQLTVWAKAKDIDFTAATTNPDSYVEAFLLNCEVDEVEDEKDEFVLDISVAADGTITVSLPSGKAYNGTLQMKGSNDLSAWTNVSEASSSYKFYKYELSL